MPGPIAKVHTRTNAMTNNGNTGKIAGKIKIKFQPRIIKYKVTICFKRTEVWCDEQINY